MNQSFRGTGVAIVTPFNDDLSIDYASFEKMINHEISGGIDYLVVLGTTGESATLTKQEKTELVAFAKDKTAGRIPIVIGIGGNNTLEVVETIKSFDLSGISAILSVAPYYNKPTQKGLYGHYKAIAEASPLPLILYNVPGRTASNIAASTTIQLAKDFSNIVAVKEASGNMAQIMEIAKNKPEGFELLSGDDALTLPMISVGCTGAISVLANSHPKEFSDLVKKALNGDFEGARTIHFRLLEYMDALFTEGNPAGVKAVLSMAGLCENNVRPPLATVSDEHYIRLQETVNEI